MYDVHGDPVFLAGQATLYLELLPRIIYGTAMPSAPTPFQQALAQSSPLFLTGRNRPSVAQLASPQ